MQRKNFILKTFPLLFHYHKIHQFCLSFEICALFYVSTPFFATRQEAVRVRDQKSSRFHVTKYKCDLEAERTISLACWCRAFYIKMDKKEERKTISIFQSAFFFGRIGTVWLGHGNLIFFSFFPILFFSWICIIAYGIEKYKNDSVQLYFYTCFCWNSYYSLESLYFQTWRFIMVVLFLKGYSLPACFSRVYYKCITCTKIID